MARPLRLEYEGAIYHVTVRGNDRRDIFLDDKDRKYLLDRLADGVDVCGVRLYLFCLMTNHFHLVFETPRANLSTFMHKVLTAYTVYFNCRHHRSGHVTQGRYGARLVEGDTYLPALSRYVHLNPIKIKKMESKTRAEKAAVLRSYSWSTYRGYIGAVKEYPFVDYGPMRSMMRGRSRKQQQREYKKYVEKMIDGEDEEILSVMNASPRSIGGESFQEWVDESYENLIQSRKVKEDIAFRKIDKSSVPAEEILEMVARTFKIDKSALLRRTRQSRYRGTAALMLCKYGGCSQRDAAEVLNLNTGAAVSYQIAQVGKQRKEDRKFDQTIQKIERQLERARK